MRFRFQLTLFGLFVLMTACCAVIASLSIRSGSRSIVESGRKLDVAIVGEGFFCVQDSGTGKSFFTRHGGFLVDPYGRLAVESPAGQLVLHPTVIVPSDWTEITIAADGQVSVRLENEVAYGAVAQVELARFPKGSVLREEIGGFYAETSDSGIPLFAIPGSSGVGYLQHGWIEEKRAVDEEQLTALAVITLVGCLGFSTFVIVVELRRQRRLVEDLAGRIQAREAETPD